MNKRKNDKNLEYKRNLISNNFINHEIDIDKSIDSYRSIESVQKNVTNDKKTFNFQKLSKEKGKHYDKVNIKNISPSFKHNKNNNNNRK